MQKMLPEDFEEIAKNAQAAVAEMHLAIGDENTEMDRRCLAGAFSDVADVVTDLALTVANLRARLDSADDESDMRAELAYSSLQAAETLLGDCYLELKKS
jgi:hypothetical protein